MLSIADGQLIRAQEIPKPETARVGANVVSVTSPDLASANILPIPDDLQPLFNALRAVMIGATAEFTEQADLTTRDGQNTWVLEFPELDPRYGFMSIEGCGARVRLIEIREPSGIRRTMLLGVPE